jgi:hypothetical protein
MGWTDDVSFRFKPMASLESDMQVTQRLQDTVDSHSRQLKEKVSRSVSQSCGPS